MHVSIQIIFNFFEFFIVPKSGTSWSVWHDYHMMSSMQRHTLWYEPVFNNIYDYELSSWSTHIIVTVWLLWTHESYYFVWGRFWHYDIMIWWHSISNPHVLQSRGQRRPVEPHHLLRCHGRFAVGHWLRSGCGLHGCLGTVLCRYLRWIIVIHVLYDMHIQIQYIHIYIQYLFVYESMIVVYLWEAYKRSHIYI